MLIVSKARKLLSCDELSATDKFPLFLFPSFRADIALIGLAVMGQNLILNMNDHGFVVSGEGHTSLRGPWCLTLSAGDCYDLEDPL